MTKWMSKIGSLLGCAIVLTGTSAIAQSRSAIVCPAGATCRGNSPAGTSGPNTTNYSVPDPTASEARDPDQEKIWDAARQLNLDSDQRAQLDSSLKAQKEESAALKKSLEDARTALAHALQNGQTPLDSEIENLTSAKARVQESELKRWAALYEVLTPDQQKQMLMMPTPLTQASTSTGVMQAQ